MSEELNEYTLEGGFVLHLDDEQIKDADNNLSRILFALIEDGNLDAAQYIAAELTNKLWQTRKNMLKAGGSPAELAELDAIVEAGN